MENNKNNEVLAYRHKPTTTATGKDVIIDRSSKHWQSAIADKGNEYEIYTVRRDDGVDFSIGDKLLDMDPGIDIVMKMNYREDAQDLWLYVSIDNTWGCALGGARKDTSVVKEESSNILKTAERLIYGDRQASYGSVSGNFGRIAQMWSAILGTEVCGKDVGLCMIAVKIAREVNKPSEDNLIDIAGYAGCLEKLEKGN